MFKAHPTPLPALPTCASSSAAQQGFTLVEILLAVIVLTTGLVGIASLSTIANRNQSTSLGEATRVNAIASDIAEIRRINDRYTCGSVTTTTASCTISSSDLSQGGYYPSDANGKTNFSNRCAYTPSTFDLVTDLASAIPTSSSASSALSSAGVTRTIATNDQAGIHRYTVSYTFGGNTVRTLTLVPTAAEWCP
jgi:prepilin-type N-terminal cleavage/methylation domain-containing protein